MMMEKYKELLIITNMLRSEFTNQWIKNELKIRYLELVEELAIDIDRESLGFDDIDLVAMSYKIIKIIRDNEGLKD